jgi:hypothetical protein
MKERRRGQKNKATTTKPKRIQVKLIVMNQKTLRKPFSFFFPEPLHEMLLDKIVTH